MRLRSPGFTAMAVTMIALGVAGNAAIFSVFSGLFPRPLPFSEAERLVDLDEAAPRWGLEYAGVSNADAQAWRVANRSFQDVAFYYRQTYGLSGLGVNRAVSAAQVTQPMAKVLRFHPVLGRDFLPEEDRPGGPAAALLGFRCWKNVFESVTSPVVGSLRDRELGCYRGITQVLFAAVAALTLIACVNVAALLLAQGSARARERAIRAAIGASRGRLVRESLAEAGLLAFCGGAAGALLGGLALSALLRLVPADLLPNWVAFRLDLCFALFAAAVAAAATLVFGLVPCVQAAASDPGECLRSGRGASFGRGRHRFLSACVVTEVALAVVLLIGGGLLLRAFRNVMQVDPGFRSENVLSFRLPLPQESYGTPERRIALLPPLLEQLAALPGARSAGAASPPLLGTDSGSFFRAEGGWQPAAGEPDPVILQFVATPGYFDAAGVRLLAGRAFTESDGAVAIVSEGFVRRFWPGESVLGRRIRFAWDEKSWMQVVGVTPDVRHYGLDRPTLPNVYLPFRLRPMEPGFAIVLRTDGDPNALTRSVREVLKRTDPDLTMVDVRTMAERVRSSLWVRRTYSWLVFVFAAVAAVLAAAGIFGVLAYVVTQRTREIGIRKALGAPASRVVREVIAGGMALAAAGTALGVLIALSSSRLVSGLLFGVRPYDVPTYAVVVLAVGLVSLCATAATARRAAKVDPVQALRSE